MNRRQALAGISALATFTLITNRSYAMESIAPVTYEEAKALGLTFRAQNAGGPNSVWLEVAFDLKGKLKDIKRVTLRSYDGDKLLVFTTLNNEADKAGQFKASFMLDRELLAKSKLGISSSLGGASVGGTYLAKLSDIAEIKELR